MATKVSPEAAGHPPPLHELKRRQRDDHGHDEDWSAYNSGIDRYQKFFAEVLGGRQIIDIVAQYPQPVVLDLMAPSGTIADLFTRLPRGTGGLGIAVSLNDLRTDEQRNEDKDRNIQQISGDLTRSDTWKRLTNDLGGKKAHLIMARPVGGIGYLPDHGGFYAVTLQRMWKLLDGDGMLLLQVPFSIGFRSQSMSIGRWIEGLRKQGINANLNGNRLCIQRSPKNPKFLPFPKSEDVMELSSRAAPNPNALQRKLASVILSIAVARSKPQKASPD